MFFLNKKIAEGVRIVRIRNEWGELEEHVVFTTEPPVDTDLQLENELHLILTRSDYER